MYRILALCCLLGLSLARQPAAPQHNADHLPDTVFSCRDKVLGGYYADPDAQCQMFHVCVKVAGVGIQDYRFLCPNGTAFDQEAQICAGWADVACEPSALYYSSDNFDLYRIGSGFESKKAPAALEDESDFHLQRAEPDILSGAHSSNFFNNREGKDVQDTQRGGQNRNQVDQPQRKKIIKKIQRRPTEASPAPSPTTRQVTSSYSSFYTPTTSRPTTARTTPQYQEYSENYNNYNNNNNNNQNYNNNYQNYKQASSTAAPADFSKISVTSYSTGDYQKTERTTTQNNNRNYNQRQHLPSDYKYNSESNSNNNNQQASFNSNAYNKSPVSTAETKNYNADSGYRSTPQPSRRTNVNRQRGQQTYRNQQSTSNYNSETSPQSYDTQSSVQYNANANKNSQQAQRYNQDNKFNNYNNGNNQETTYQIKYSTPSTQQTTAKSNNEYTHKQTSQYNNNYNNGDNENFGKTKASTKYEEKKATYTTKQSTPQYTENQRFNNAPAQTPAPKFNTNLLYDNNNNQQSTPDYYKTDYNNQEYRNTNPTTSTNKQYSSVGDYNQYQQKATDNSQFSTPQPFSYNQGVSQSQTYEQKPTANVQKYSTSQPSSYSQGASPSPKAFEQKPISDVPKISTAQPYYSQSQQSYEPKSTAYVQKISTAQPNYNQGSSNYNQKQYEQKSTSNVQQYSTALPSFNQGSGFSQRSYEQKSSPNVQYYSTTGPSTSVQYTQRYETKSTASPIRSKIPDDYDDGQYRPEVHEREAGGEYDVTARHNIRKEDSYRAPQESEFLKTANSINIAASRNQLARERQFQTSSTTRQPVTQQQKITQTTPRPVQSTVAPKSASSNIPILSSTQPRPFSLRKPDPPQPPKKFVESKASTSSQAKPVSSKKNKDVSYDYAYYDNSEPYSEYENIEEFGRTSKKH